MVIGTDYNGNEVEFKGTRLCECPLEQDMTCGHWYIRHTEDCPLHVIGHHWEKQNIWVEEVKSCSGPWYGSGAGLNTVEDLVKWKKGYGSLTID